MVADGCFTKSMNQLIITFRCAQFVAHNFHNFAKGYSFFSDHEFLGELYGTYESAYDGLVERTIGGGKQIDLPDVTMQAADKAKAFAPDKMGCDEMFATLLSMEESVCAWCKTYSAGATLGTANLLQGLADESEARQYKLKQRTKA